ncbi:MAG: response regulator [Polyangiaceae bacterium]|nr:response regulator [Polyangiaceae bacterium]
MTSAASAMESWRTYVAAASEDVRTLDDGIGMLEGGAEPFRMSSLAHVAFRVGLSSLLVGAEEVGRLALAVERALDVASAGAMPLDVVVDALAAPRTALRDAMAQLANPDKSGARVEGIPIVELTATLTAALAGVAGAPRGPVAGAVAPAPKPAAPAAAVEEAQIEGAFVWAPAVDDDMVELFFDEASERIEGISGKLIELERRSGDEELLRDLFRDLHTVKGSSAMVGLLPVNHLAHAAEDLVGQLREGTRAADAPVVNALLATLDALRSMLEAARARQPIHLDPRPLIRALRDPGAAAPAAVAPRPVAPSVEAEETGAVAKPTGAAAAGAPPAAKQTIRVDFDKLDRLLNLVGELVLGRDGLRTACTALGSVAGELSADRALARRIGSVQKNGGASDRRGRDAEREAHGIVELTEELGRVERVLDSIAGELDTATSNLDSISGELRDQVMRLRMVRVGGVFRKHQRTVRDLGQSLGKKIRLELFGEETELDKLLVEALDEPLLHLVRNAVDHGVEGPAERAAAGKPAESTVVLEATHKGNQVVIRIADDGRGMDPTRLKQKARERGIVTDAELETMDDRSAFELIFRPGFSTASTVSDVSGRGVGMDIVRQTIVTRLKGTIDIESTLGQGTAFILRLPLTLAIIDVLLARVAGEIFALPLDIADRTMVILPDDVRLVGDREVIEVDDRNIALVRLSHVLELDDPHHHAEEPMQVVLTEQAGEFYALCCDHLLGKKEIVVKSLGEVLSGVPCIVGATLLGDRCALILDVPAIIERALRKKAFTAPRPTRLATTGSRGNILIVDDSDTVREALRRLLSDAGFTVTTADDGRAGLELCRAKRFDLVSTDVMMPHMDGYELTRALRALPAYRDVPIVMVTSRGERIDRVRGFDAGVDEYITKPHDRQLLLRAVEKLLSHPKEGSNG